MVDLSYLLVIHLFSVLVIDEMNDHFVVINRQTIAVCVTREMQFEWKIEIGKLRLQKHVQSFLLFTSCRQNFSYKQWDIESVTI